MGQANNRMASSRDQAGKALDNKPACLARHLLVPDIPSIAMSSCVGRRPLELAPTTGKPVHSRAGTRKVVTIVHTGPILFGIRAQARLSLKAGSKRQISLRGSTMFNCPLKAMCMPKIGLLQSAVARLQHLGLEKSSVVELSQDIHRSAFRLGP